ncbi:MAG: GIY-YIG nuclease family protein [Candidatus Omnitrophica bacterium]|nr:GIY-YIG nuclease family protein [Candidatus Omnitrophota bacterium]
MWFLYILRCENGAFYTGVTKNLKRRLKEHASTAARKYTTFNQPEALIYSESFEDKLEAEARESQIKRWSRSKKLALLDGDLLRLKVLSKSRD